VSDTADAVSLSSSTPQRQLSSINNLLQKSVCLLHYFQYGDENPRKSPYEAL